MRRVVVVLCVAGALVIASVVSIRAGHDSRSVDGNAFEIHGRWCQRARNDTAADAVLAGKVVSASFGTVTVGQRVDWAANPFNDPSWQTELQSLDWLTPSIVRGSPADVARVRSVLKSWIADNPWHGTATGAAWSQRIAALRARVLLCAGQLFRTARAAPPNRKGLR